VTFATGATLTMGQNPIDVVVADFNHDSRPDIAAMTVNGQLVLALADGPDSFAVPSSLTIGGSALALADYNRDGFQDLVVGDYTGNVGIVLDHSGTFAAS
jgi:hypothetical protein